MPSSSNAVVVENEPENLDAKLQLAEVCEEMGDREKALDLVNDGEAKPFIVFTPLD